MAGWADHALPAHCPDVLLLQVSILTFDLFCLGDLL